MPRPSAANAFNIVLAGQRHVTECSPFYARSISANAAISLQELAQCVMEKFQADGPSGFVAGSFGVDTILVVPEAAAKLAAPEGLVLKWAS